MKNTPLLANYSLNVFLEAFLFLEGLFFRACGASGGGQPRSQVSAWRVAQGCYRKAVSLFLRELSTFFSATARCAVRHFYHSSLALYYRTSEFLYFEIYPVSLVLFHSQLLASMNTCNKTQKIFSRTCFSSLNCTHNCKTFLFPPGSAIVSQYIRKTVI